MSTEAALILLAAGFAVGVTILLADVVPVRAKLGDLLAPAEPRRELGADFADKVVRVARRLGLRIPHDDLDLVGMPADKFVLYRITFAAVGAVWIPVLSSVLEIAGVAPAIYLTGALTVAATAVGWFLPQAVLKSKVTRARTVFAAAVASYCHLVALGRLGDRGPGEALRYPASLGNGWAFARIRAALDEAALRGDMPWDGLRELAAATGVRELDDLGHIVTSAGEDGASIVDTLRAKAKSVVGQQLARQRTGAAIHADRMDMPVALLGMTFIVFLAYPGVAAMLGR